MRGELQTLSGKYFVNNRGAAMGLDQGQDGRGRPLLRHSYYGRVIAPCDADVTSAPYFANTPDAYRGLGAFHCAMRR